MNKKGFTLVELAVVLVIISILACIAIPMFVSYGDTTKNSAVKFDLAESYRVAKMCYHDGLGPITWPDLVTHGFRLSKGVVYNLEDGGEETFLANGYYIGREEVVYQIDASGVITKRN